MFYDFEATQESGIHKANWVDCQEFEGNIFNFETIEEFFEFVFAVEEVEVENADGKTQRKKEIPKYKEYTFIAHNAKAYDLQFVLKYCVERQIKPYFIFNGTKIMMMEIPRFGIRFIDSINFAQSALSLFPKTFGFKELKKRTFPELFQQNLQQKLHWSHSQQKHFGSDQMSEQKRKEFHEWYDTQRDMVFDFQKKIERILPKRCGYSQTFHVEIRRRFPLIGKYRSTSIHHDCFRLFHNLSKHLHA